MLRQNNLFSGKGEVNPLLFFTNWQQGVTIVNLRMKEKVFFVSFVFPALAIFITFYAYPIVSGFYYSLTNWSGFGDIPRFIGLDNFKALLDDDLIKIALKNNLIMTIIVVLLQNFLALGFAILLNQRFIGVNFFRAVIFIPVLLSTAVIGYIWDYIYSPIIGVLNSIMGWIGFSYFTDFDWLGNPKYAIFSISAVIIWQYTGYSMVIYLAGLQMIPKDLYESANIDGAGRWLKIRHITIPLLANSITINSVISVIGCLKMFDQVYILTSGGPGHATEVFGTLIYMFAFKTGQLGYGSALAVLLTVLVVAVATVQYRILKKREVEF